MDIILQATQRLDQHLGNYISKLKGFSTTNLWQAFPKSFTNEEKIFDDGYNDRILKYYGHLDVWIDYVRDNPRRLWLMRENQYFFTRTTVVTSDSRSYHIYGNRFLLNYPLRRQVAYHRAYTDMEWLAISEELLKVAKNGGVLVSPVKTYSRSLCLPMNEHARLLTI